MIWRSGEIAKDSLIGETKDFRVIVSKIKQEQEGLGKAWAWMMFRHGDIRVVTEGSCYRRKCALSCAERALAERGQ